MTNSSDLDAWLTENGMLVETYSGITQSGMQLIFACPTIESFKKMILDWKTTYQKDLVSKCNSGSNRFTYIIAGQTKGYAITISDTLPAPGVAAGSSSGFLEDIHAWFDANPDLRALFKDGVLAGLSFVIAYQAVVMNHWPKEYITIGIGIFMGLAWLLRWLQSHTTWPVIGARILTPEIR